MLCVDAPKDALDAEEAVRRAVHSVRSDPELVHLANLPNEQMRSLCKNAVQSISIWDAGEDLPAEHCCINSGDPVNTTVFLSRRLSVC